MCNFESDIQALFALIDIQFDTTVNPQIQSLILKCDNKSPDFYLKLAKLSEEATTLVISSLSKNYKNRLNLYYSDSGLALFIRLSHDFKIKDVLTTK